MKNHSTMTLRGPSSRHTHPIRHWSRRAFLGALAATGAGTILSARALPEAPMPSEASDILLRAIPASGERIPVIGMGTWITFNVGTDRDLRAHRTRVLEAFFARGGGMIDSSPMYGTSEAVIGHALDRLGVPGSMFSATKVWTGSTGRGREQVSDSLNLWGVPRLDLMQVHNLRNWRGHLETLRELRECGLIRYIGVTTSHGRRHDELETIMRQESLDFVQLTYNIVDREAERRLLPLAGERGMAVIANRPFQRRRLFRRFGDFPLPEWASEIGVANWAQFFLKFIVSHPDVTCAIPATSRVDHMIENMGALHGPLPDAGQRARMAQYVANL